MTIITEKKKYTLYRVADCEDKMFEGFHRGKVKGSTTYIPDVDKCWTWRKQEFNLWTGYMNEGKALDIETWIPTPRGFCFMRDLEVGDEVFDEKGEICKVVGVTDIMQDRPCYQLTFSDGAKVIADENHEWVVDTLQSRGSKSRQSRRKTETGKRGTDQRNKCLNEIRLTTKEMAGSVRVYNQLNYSIKLPGAAKYPERVLPLDPYLLGAWLGDGTTGDCGMTSNDPFIMDQFRKQFKVTKRSAKYAYGVIGLREKLELVGILKRKFIPDEYIFGSVEQRLELVRGLMDTDGYTDTIGRCEFVTINEGLALQVYTLLCSLGIQIYFRQDFAKLYGRIISSRFRIAFKTDIQVFKLPRKLMRQIGAGKNRKNSRIITSIEYFGLRPTKCIEVDSPNHMYLCTESYIPTHNSLFLRYLSLIKMLMDGWTFLFCAPEDFPPEEFYDDMLHTIVGLPTDKSHPHQMPEDLYIRAMNIIKEKMLFLYMDPGSTIADTLNAFAEVMKEIRIDVAIIDPLIKFARPKDLSDRDDIYAQHITTICTDFCRKRDLSLHLVLHQLTPRTLDNGYYPKPSAYQIKGGGTWSDGSDNVLTVWRPEYAKDHTSTIVHFASKKIKKQKLVGIPQEIQMKFDRRSNRYVNFQTERDLFDFDEILRKYMK